MSRDEMRYDPHPWFECHVLEEIAKCDEKSSLLRWLEAAKSPFMFKQKNKKLRLAIGKGDEPVIQFPHHCWNGTASDGQLPGCHSRRFPEGLVDPIQELQKLLRCPAINSLQLFQPSPIDEYTICFAKNYEPGEVIFGPVGGEIKVPPGSSSAARESLATCNMREMGLDFALIPPGSSLEITQHAYTAYLMSMRTSSSSVPANCKFVAFKVAGVPYAVLMAGKGCIEGVEAVVERATVDRRGRRKTNEGDSMAGTPKQEFKAVILNAPCKSSTSKSGAKLQQFSIAWKGAVAALVSSRNLDKLFGKSEALLEGGKDISLHTLGNMCRERSLNESEEGLSTILAEVEVLAVHDERIEAAGSSEFWQHWALSVIYRLQRWLQNNNMTVRRHGKAADISPSTGNVSTGTDSVHVRKSARTSRHKAHSHKHHKMSRQEVPNLHRRHSRHAGRIHRAPMPSSSSSSSCDMSPSSLSVSSYTSSAHSGSSSPHRRRRRRRSPSSDDSCSPPRANGRRQSRGRGVRAGVVRSSQDEGYSNTSSRRLSDGQLDSTRVHVRPDGGASVKPPANYQKASTVSTYRCLHTTKQMLHQNSSHEQLTCQGAAEAMGQHNNTHHFLINQGVGGTAPVTPTVSHLNPDAPPFVPCGENAVGCSPEGCLIWLADSM